MENLQKLDRILLSNNAVDEFYQTYNTDKEFSLWLDSILPEVDLCEKQAQDTPWHKYNVLGHILHSVEAINRQTSNLSEKDRKMLSYVMFFHDIGKPKCHIRREKNGKMVDSFFGHNVESEKVFRRVSTDFGFDSKTADIMAMLILKHDIFMFIKDFKTKNPYWKTLSPKVINDEIADLNTVGDGKTLMKYLIWIGRSDSLAQNEKMTADSLRLVDKMEKMLETL